MPALAVVFIVMSTVLGAAAAYSSAQASKRAGQYNAQVARQQAEAARQKAAFDVEMHREKVRRLQAQQRTRAAVSGLTMESFSPVFEETAESAKMDELAIRYGGDLESQSYSAKSRAFDAKAADASKAGFLDVGTTILGGASLIASGSGKKTTKKT